MRVISILLFLSLLFSPATANTARSLDQGGEDCLDPTDLTSQPLPILVSGTTDGYLDDFSINDLIPPGPSCWIGPWTPDTGIGLDVTYLYTVPFDGELLISLCGSDFNTSLFVYRFTGICPPIPEELLCGNDDVCGLQSELLTPPLLAGEQILIVVDGAFGESGLYNLSIESLDPSCAFESAQPIQTEIVALELRGAQILNATIDPQNRHSFYGRSLLLATQSLTGNIEMVLATLDNYNDAPNIQAEFSFTLPADPLLDGFCFAAVERMLGNRIPELPAVPELLEFAGDPLLMIGGESSGMLKLINLRGDDVIGPWTGLDFGITDFHPSRLAFDNDNLNLIAYDEQNLLLHTIHFPFDSDPYSVASAPMPDLTGQHVTNIDYNEGSEILLIATENHIRHYNFSDPSTPVWISDWDPGCMPYVVALSDGYCPTEQGQLVGVCDDGFGGLDVCNTPCAPSPLPMPYPITGSYLEPTVNFVVSSENPLDWMGPIEIHATIDGPWWPAEVRFQSSMDGVNYTDFGVDTDGNEVAELSTMPSPTNGNGWFSWWQPIQIPPIILRIRICAWVPEINLLIYVYADIRTQADKKPKIEEPAEDGDHVEPPADSGSVILPDPSLSDCTLVERREPENETAEDIDPTDQHREGLPPWDFGDGVPVPGGVHCAPTAAAQNLIALAKRNPCLCKKLQCFWGYDEADIDGDCSFPSEEDITKLILWLGFKSRTNLRGCGTPYAYSAKGVDDFVKFICDTSIFDCAPDCDPGIKTHIISCSRGDNMKWGDVVEEFDERQQTIMLRVTYYENGDTLDHRVSITMIGLPDSSGCVKVEIADPGSGLWEDIVVDTRSTPPRIKSAEDTIAFPFKFITGAIAMSNPDSLSRPPDEEEQRGRDHASTLDDPYVWEHVLTAPGAISSFPLENLHPGYWRYRVKVYTVSGDSASGYRTFFVPFVNLELTAIRDGNDLRLNWNRDANAASYSLFSSPVSGGPFAPLTTVVDTFHVTGYDSLEMQFYQVQPNY